MFLKKKKVNKLNVKKILLYVLGKQKGKLSRRGDLIDY